MIGMRARERVRARYGDSCVWCAVSLDWTATIAPVEFGLPQLRQYSRTWNLLPSCSSCRDERRGTRCSRFVRRRPAARVDALHRLLETAQHRRVDQRTATIAAKERARLACAPAAPGAAAHPDYTARVHAAERLAERLYGPERSRVRTLMAWLGPCCTWCARELSEDGSGPDRPTIDHVVPRSWIKDDRLANAVLACSSCNGARDDTPVSMWLAQLSASGAPVLVSVLRAQLAFNARLAHASSDEAARQLALVDTLAAAR